SSSDGDERFADAREFLAAVDAVAEALNLPTYLVPVPHNSAAARTAAAPTNMQGIDAANVFEPTGFIDTSESATEVFGSDIAQDATSVLPSEPEPLAEPGISERDFPREREPLSFETRYDGPPPAADSPVRPSPQGIPGMPRSEEHTSELQS